MKRILLSLLVLSFFSAQAQMTCENVLFFQLNAGKGTCPPAPSTEFCNPEGTHNFNVEGRLTVCYTDIPDGFIPRIASIEGYNYIFCVDQIATTGNRTCVTYCIYSTVEGDVFNLGNVGKLLTINFNFGTCVVEGPGNQGALPVSIKSFTANRSKQTVGVKFETLSESNNKGFYVQRNTNGNWENIAFIFSQAPNGNSGTPLSYEYNDLNPIKGVSQYRLQQVDIDNRFRYSEVRMVRGEEQPSKHLLFPNPSSDGKVNIVFDVKSATRNILVSDMSGRVIKSFRNVTAANLSIDNLENGVYSIQIIDLSTSETVVEKVIIKKR